MSSLSAKKDFELSQEVLEFTIFCIENLAIKLGSDPSEVYAMLTADSDLLYSYIVPCYDSLHTQDKEYIMTDLLGVMKKKNLIA